MIRIIYACVTFDLWSSILLTEENLIDLSKLFPFNNSWFFHFDRIISFHYNVSIRHLYLLMFSLHPENHPDSRLLEHLPE